MASFGSNKAEFVGKTDRLSAGNGLDRSGFAIGPAWDANRQSDRMPLFLGILIIC